MMNIRKQKIPIFSFEKFITISTVHYQIISIIRFIVTKQPILYRLDKILRF